MLQTDEQRVTDAFEKTGIPAGKYFESFFEREKWRIRCENGALYTATFLDMNRMRWPTRVLHKYGGNTADNIHFTMNRPPRDNEGFGLGDMIGF